MSNEQIIEQSKKALSELVMSWPFEVKDAPFEPPNQIGDQADVLTPSAGFATGRKKFLSPESTNLEGAWKITTLQARAKNANEFSRTVSDDTHYVVITSSKFDSLTAAASAFILDAESTRLGLDWEHASSAGVDWTYVAPCDYDRPDFVESDQPQVDFRAVEGTYARTTVLNRNLSTPSMGAEF